MIGAEDVSALEVIAHIGGAYVWLALGVAIGVVIMAIVSINRKCNEEDDEDQG